MTTPTPNHPQPNPHLPQPKFDHLNLGAGFHHLPNCVNLDANPKTNPDLLLNLETTSLLSAFPTNSFSYVRAFDVIEHLFRFHAIPLLRDIFAILKPNGSLHARLPDAEAIIKSPIPIPQKLTALFGGQDIPQSDHPAQAAARAAHPEFFTHRYGWTPETFEKTLSSLHFVNPTSTREFPNFITIATKLDPIAQLATW